ncbi:unnamed protein product [Nyctereutes procyonoides]|uniref:(raccoon dog) hypothetical protein n=1 Tax=Nyctereutes procyonoides TaxID=34880 RepID=A0A811ZBI2_NYCPR|nr:unnamed protein product [Nyctereutes procyonoides]
MFLHLLLERNLYKTQVFRQSKRWPSATWKGPSPEPDHAGTLMVELPGSGTVKNKSVYKLPSLRYFVIATQTD